MTSANPSFDYEIILHPLGRDRWRVEFESETLIEACDDPAYDACRALLARGITGRLQTRLAGQEYGSLRLDIEHGAKLRAQEGAASGPRLVKWRPYPTDGICRVAVTEKAAADDLAGGVAHGN